MLPNVTVSHLRGPAAATTAGCRRNFPSTPTVHPGRETGRAPLPCAGFHDSPFPLSPHPRDAACDPRPPKEMAAVRQERDLVDHLHMAREDAQLPAAFEVPQAEASRRRWPRRRACCRGIGHAVNPVPVAKERGGPPVAVSQRSGVPTTLPRRNRSPSGVKAMSSVATEQVNS